MTFPVGQQFVSKAFPKFMHPSTYARNSVAPNAAGWQAITGGLTHALRWRRKMLWSSQGNTTTWLAKGGAGTRVRFKGRFRTGTLASYLVCRVQVAATAGVSDPYITVVFTAVGGGTSNTAEIHIGSSLSGETDATFESWIGATRVACDAEQEYTFVCNDVQNARLVSICIYEESLAPSVGNGYPQARYSALGPIYDASRQEMVDATDSAMRLNSSVLHTWSVNNYTAPKTNGGSASLLNVIDGTNANAQTSSSPAFWVDTAFCNTVSRTTVPCEFAVYASSSSVNGECYLMGSATSTLASITGINAEGWYTATANIPPAEQRLYVLFGDTFTAGDVSLWSFALAQYDP